MKIIQKIVRRTVLAEKGNGVQMIFHIMSQFSDLSVGLDQLFIVCFLISELLAMKLTFLLPLIISCKSPEKLKKGKVDEQESCLYDQMAEISHRSGNDAPLKEKDQRH